MSSVAEFQSADHKRVRPGRWMWRVIGGSFHKGLLGGDGKVRLLQHDFQDMALQGTDVCFTYTTKRAAMEYILSNEAEEIAS